MGFLLAFFGIMGGFMILKDLLKENDKFVVILNENNRKEFLTQAKKEGFKWYSGKEIQEKDECFFHIMVEKDDKISNISTMCYVKSKELQALPKYEY